MTSCNGNGKLNYPDSATESFSIFDEKKDIVSFGETGLRSDEILFYVSIITMILTLLTFLRK